uniref:Aminopeptidase n=1 Tax=Cyprinus carpio TaxID=7962 RepID=A0A8C2KFU5_CYPCA
MGKGFYISRPLGFVLCGLGIVAMLTIFSLSVVYTKEKRKNQVTAINETGMVTTAAPHTTPAPSNEPWDKYRLPDTLLPEYYNVTLWPRLVPDEQGMYIFTGTSGVALTCIKETNLIIIHSNKLNYTLTLENHHAKLTGLGGTSAPAILKTWFQTQTQFMVILLNEKLEVGKSYWLYMEFHGELSDDLAGFYRSQYTENGVKKVVATTQMQATAARNAFPCFDEPSMKAVFHLTLQHPPETVALANGMELGTESITIEDKKLLQTRFKPTEKMSTYLLAFVISEFTKIQSSEKTNVLIRIWGRKEAIESGQGDYALNVTFPILKYFENYYNTTYPLSKSDQVALPDFAAGAMENWGLVTYREQSLFYDPKESSNGDKEWVVTVIAHELAHMWFGNLVTMRWWNDLWLNEGFASYVSYLGADYAEPTWNIVSNIYIFNIFCHLPPVKVHKMNYADSRIQLPASIKEIMNRWILQMGYPVVTIDTRTGNISQQHFLIHPEAVVEKPSDYNYEWFVPITWMKSGSNMGQHWLLTKTALYEPMKTGTDWLLANLNVMGYYRVNYDPQNWERLLTQLTTDHKVIPVLNRGQIIDDAFNLARAQIINITLALRTTKYLLKEKEYIPWESAIRNLQYFFLMFDRTEVYGPLQTYLRRNVQPLFDHFQNITSNWTQKPPRYMDHQFTSDLSGLIQFRDSVQFYSFRFVFFFHSRIPPNLKNTVYCNAIAAGGVEEWDFGWQMFKKSTIAAEAEKLLYGLSCTKEPWLLNRYLEFTIDPKQVRKQDAAFAIVYISGNVIGQPLVWDFVRAKWEQITKDYDDGSFFFGRLIQGITKKFSTEFELKQLQRLKEDIAASSFSFGTQAIEQAIEKTKANIKWVSKNKAQVMNWLTEQST